MSLLIEEKSKRVALVALNVRLITIDNCIIPELEQVVQILHNLGL